MANKNLYGGFDKNAVRAVLAEREKREERKKVNIPNGYPFSEFGGYIHHEKISENEEKNTCFPDDGRFDVNCRLASKVVKMSEARILYENATPQEKEDCSKSSICGLKCYLN